MKTVAEIEITTEGISLNGHPVETKGVGADMLNEAYRHYLASELVLQQLDEERFVPREDRAVVLFNRSGSIEADRHYQSTISDADNFFPSPSVFVYTLPNIVTGEIAIRNKYLGETSFCVLDHQDEQKMQQVIEGAFQDGVTTSILTGWVDYADHSHFSANIKLITNKNK